MFYQLSFVLCILGHLMQADAAVQYHDYNGESEQPYVPQVPQFPIADSVSTFSIDLLRTLNRASTRFNENVVCSPISVYSALALLLLGSSGSTSTELRSAMQLPPQLKNLNSVHSEISRLLKLLQDENIRIGNKTISQVTFADAIFVDDHLTIKENYKTLNERYYNSRIQKLDFKDGLAAIDEINRWIAMKTNNQIPQVFTEPLDQQSSIVEVTSVYFSGGWSERFSPHSTKTESFISNERSIDVEMMSNKGRVPYFQSSYLKCESIQLDFHGRHYSAVFILPYEGQTITRLMESLNKVMLKTILDTTDYKGVNYKIPKMKFFSSRSLKEPLSSKGLQKIFEKANLGAMLETSGQKISDVKHAVEIEVDELGAKATALTSVRIEPLAAKNPPENTIDFFLNRPFIFMIYHRTTGTVLFTAIVRDPKQ